MPSKKNTYPLEESLLTGNVELSPNVHLISFERKYDFIPGQVIKIGLDLDIPPRIYSICSGNRDSEISVLFNVKKEGLLTPHLAALVPGEKILASNHMAVLKETAIQPGGLQPEQELPLFTVCSVPAWEKIKLLIHGVKYLNQFYFEDELEEAIEEKYIRCCSRESSCNTFPGRVTDYISQLDALPDTTYYICGKSLMVVEVRDLLISKGVSFEKIIAEIYF